MNHPVWTDLITSIHASNHSSVLAITGGGSRAISQLLEVPGGSRTLLEARVPYSATALEDWLGSTTQQSCSPQTARAMAMSAWMRARQLALTSESNPNQLLGLGATASLVSDRPKQGDHRIHLATQTATATANYSLTFTKNARDRLTEEGLASQLILLSLALACEIPATDAFDDLQSQLKPGEQINFSQQIADPSWTDLLLSNQSHISYPATLQPQAIFPGAFNPPHAAHHQIAQLAAAKLGCPVTFELSITNVDKPPLDFAEINARINNLKQLEPQTSILLTDAPTFRQKSALFPGCTFVVGADTLARIANPKYYSGPTNHDGAGTFEAAIEQIADRGCRFLVFGRQIDGKFQVLSDLKLPPALSALCDEIPTNEFHHDISSTELRSQKEKK